MSRGPGIVQRKLLSLMAENRHGAWNTPQLSDLVYGKSRVQVVGIPGPYIDRWPRARLIAINRALNSMTLPDGWRYEQCGTRYHYLYNAKSKKSRRAAGTGRSRSCCVGG
jgi:hypothetical protein